MVKIIVATLSAGVASAFGTISEFPIELTSLMDQTVDPCTDFFSYSCGTWYNKTILHANQSTTTIRAKQAVIMASVGKLVEKLLKAKVPKLTEFYDACMDTATLDTLGLAPIEDHLKAIRSANSTVEAIFRGATISMATGVPLFVKLSPLPNAVNYTRTALYAVHPGMPFDPKYFHEPLWADVEKPYRKYIATLFTLAGHAEVEGAIDDMIKFERIIAGVDLPKRRLQEAAFSDNVPYPLSVINASYPLGLGLPLQAFGFDVCEGSNTILLDDHYYLDFLEGFLRSMSVDALKTIIEYKVLDFNARYLSTPFVKARSAFYDMVIEGLKELPSRSTICRYQVQTSIGELLGTYYLKEVWTADIAARAESLVLALKAALKTGLESAEWLDDATRTNVTTKMSKLSHFLGGPKNPQTYSALTFDPKAYVGNLNKVSAFDTAFNLAKIDTAYDKQIWLPPFTAQTVNEYYFALTNLIVFPAATLQPPNFDVKADPSVNYGIVGYMIGHEITHGFDSRTTNYDSDGKINPLWSATVVKTLEEKAKCFIEQFGSMDVKSDVTGDLLGKLDGKLTLGEVICDNGGLNAAYRAYRDHVNAVADATKYTKEAGEKMFWIAHAQLRCEKVSDVFLRIHLADPHPPGRQRLFGEVQNSVDFAKAFNCPVGSPMNPTKKCGLWDLQTRSDSKE
ncbi:hypothetical protein H257_17116 [Aphanomyces astaci]|uniref:Peptidase M13 C-terminal domain-containing protein n=1 Tax=Aphanomyces astaci TaxID=112090 RepID=W4FI69_APHAT|nr:hypothetical protein H257_17116 [Aphanomyces astaci]ETV66448.1 hypothetical protein H257_17116 [Aphanomyces astaci]|eukprot:XP_009844082.1 hypothetical protein H257_17116 [Aphanomyces astaci]